MPFKQAKLPDEAIDTISRWIDLGAPYDQPLVNSTVGNPSENKPLEVSKEHQNFWAFRSLGRVSPPSAGASSRGITPIDQFIRQKLESKGLRPNRIANRHVLIRRAYLDLLGFPPEPEEVDAFIRDSFPDAYEKLIDRLLESPHYGERWARHWMDIARFAESEGFEQDYDRPYAYHYRDFLIRSLNSDMPYDQFVRWQLAGDELAPEDSQAMVATGFLGAGPFSTQITEAEFETTRYDELDDMIGTVGTAMLGLTVGCARCHDHKYDPISNRDYYRLAAVFGHTIRSEIDYDPDQKTYLEKKQKWSQKYEILRAEQAKYDKYLSVPFAKWLKRLERGGEVAIPKNTSWRVLDITSFESKNGANFEKLEDGSVLVSGPNPKLTTYTFTTETYTTGITSIRLEALTHPSLPGQGPGRSHSGQFDLGDFRIQIQPLAVGEVDPFSVSLVAGRATGVDGVLSLSGLTGWALSPSDAGVAQAAVFDFSKPVGFEGGTRLIVSMRFAWNSQFALGRPRLSLSSENGLEATVGGGVSQNVVEGLEAVKQSGLTALSEKQKTALFEWFAHSDKKRRQYSEALRLHLNMRPFSAKTKIQVTAEGFPPTGHAASGRGYPHFYDKTYFLNRGDATQKGDVATPGFLQVLMRNNRSENEWRVTSSALREHSKLNRTALSHWITDVDNGGGALLARVIVNRLWHHHFGQGIVATPNDFGMQGDRPTHPQLLEWLARDLVDHGWRLKRLHKMIMMSKAYQLSSEYDPAKTAADANNLYHWRWTPRRLEAEAIRDSLLKVSKLLDTTMYGPGSLRADMRRRSVYFFIKRSEPIPSLMLFDWPEHLVGIGRRSSTTIAPQALMFLNSPQARRYAEGLADRLKGLRGSRIINEAYRIAYGRTPTIAEVAEGQEFILQQKRLYQTKGSTDKAKAEMVDYCQSLLSLNEFLYVR